MFRFESVIACRNDPAPLLLVLVTTNVTGAAPTTVATSSKLLLGFKSACDAVTFARITRVPAAKVDACTWNDADAPLARDGIEQVIALGVEVHPAAVTALIPAGRSVVTTTSLAASGPLLVTSMS